MGRVLGLRFVPTQNRAVTNGREAKMTAEILQHPNAGQTVAPKAMISMHLFRQIIERMAMHDARAATALLSLAYAEGGISEAEYEFIFPRLEIIAGATASNGNVWGQR
jgi:hypothetical protein